MISRQLTIMQDEIRLLKTIILGQNQAKQPLEQEPPDRLYSARNGATVANRSEVGSGGV